MVCELRSGGLTCGKDGAGDCAEGGADGAASAGVSLL